MGEGRVRVEFDVTEAHANSLGTLHGGAAATLVDIVTTTALMATPKGDIAAAAADADTTDGDAANAATAVEAAHPGVSVDMCIS